MRDSKGNRKYLNEKERSRFFRKALELEDPARCAFALLLFFTGCRISEGLSLTGDRVDQSDGCVVLRTLKQRKDNAFRSVPVPNELIMNLLKSSLDGGNGQLWNLSRTSAYRLIKGVMISAKIEGAQASPKGLRHGFAIACIEKDVPLPTVQKWLGHSRIETTAIYLEIVGKEERKFAKRLWPRGFDGKTTCEGHQSESISDRETV